MELDPLENQNDNEESIIMCRENPLTVDHPDYAPHPLRPSDFDITMLYFSIVIHIIDIFTDINVACQYYFNGKFYYFIATVVIILVPAIVNSCVSLRMYVMDMQETTVAAKRNMGIRILLVLFQLAPVVRYYDSLKFAHKSRKAEKAGNKAEQEHYFRLMLKEDADVSLLRVFESFLESAPQLVLQITFLLNEGEKPLDPASISVYHQIFSITSSLVGMALTLVSYQRNIRFAQEDKDNISKIGSTCIFFWHFFVTVSRIFVMSALASLVWSWTLLALTIHWITMTISLSLLESHEFCSSPMFEHTTLHQKLANFLFSAILGLVYIFTYITPGEGSTCCRYSSFYSICFFENVLGVVLFYQFVDVDVLNRWYFYPLMTASVIPFVLGCVFMILYYWKFHPSHYTPPSILPQRRNNRSKSVPPLSKPLSPNSTSCAQNGNAAVVNSKGVTEIKTPL